MCSGRAPIGEENRFCSPFADELTQRNWVTHLSNKLNTFLGKLKLRGRVYGQLFLKRPYTHGSGFLDRSDAGMGSVEMICPEI